MRACACHVASLKRVEPLANFRDQVFIFKIEYLRFCVIYNIYMYVPSHPLMAVHLGNDSNSSIKVKWTWLC